MRKRMFSTIMIGLAALCMAATASAVPNVNVVNYDGDSLKDDVYAPSYTSQDLPVSIRMYVTYDATVDGNISNSWSYDSQIVTCTDIGYTALDPVIVDTTTYTARLYEAVCWPVGTPTLDTPTNVKLQINYDEIGGKAGCKTSDTAKLSFINESSPAASRKAMALDKGLWWIHDHLDRYTEDGVKYAQIDFDGNWDPGSVSDAFALQALVDNGHFPFENKVNDFYVDAAERLMNEITRWILVTPAISKGSTVLQEGDLPEIHPEYLDPPYNTTARQEANVDGLMMAPWSDHLEYELPVFLRAIASAVYDAGRSIDNRADACQAKFFIPTHDMYGGLIDPPYTVSPWNRSGNGSLTLSSFTYGEIIKNIVEYVGWAQLYEFSNSYNYTWVRSNRLDGDNRSIRVIAPDDTPIEKYDTSPYEPLTVGNRGSWNYWMEGWNDPDVTYPYGAGWGDVALAFWNVLAFKAVEDAGYAIPQYIKDDLDDFTTSGLRQDLFGGATDGLVYFGPNDGRNGRGVYYELVERCAEWLVVMQYLGVDINDTTVDRRASAALAFMDGAWAESNHNMDIGQTHLGPHTATRPAYTQYTDSYTYDVTNGDITWDSYIATAPPGPWGSFFHTFELNVDETIKYGFQQGYVDATYGWTPVKDSPSVNVFALFAAKKALSAYSVAATFPTTDTVDWPVRIETLLVDAQLDDGGFDENNWVYGSPFGTPWGIMGLSE